MYEDQTPPNGDFAAYIEARTRSGGSSLPGMPGTAGLSAMPGVNPAPTVARAARLAEAAGAADAAGLAGLRDLLRRRLASLPGADGSSGSTAMQDSFATSGSGGAALVTEIKPLAKGVFWVLLLLAFSGVFGAPFASLLRFTALAVLVWLVRRAIRRAPVIVGLLRQSAALARQNLRNS